VVEKPLSVREISGDALDIAQQLNQLRYGDHILLIYPNLDSIRKIYSHYCRTALENDELVLLLTYYETADRVRHTLKETGIDVEKYEKEGSLMIIEDITRIYFGSGVDFFFFLNLLGDRIEKWGKNGISVFADMGVFYHFNNKGALVRFENSLPTKFEIKLKRFCSYHIQDYDRLEERERHDLLEHHYLRVIVPSYHGK
jgi:KaiC/GvpD/RAD55 family RecA-like ATPase